MANNKPLVLVHKAMSHIENGAAFDIMLSPQFYILKREEIPVRFRYQARRLAPSILENLLPADGNYNYFVFRDGERWAFIAYDSDEISSFLRSKSVAVEKISKLYFAQQAVDKFTIPVSLDNDEALNSMQDIVTVVPRSLLPSDTEYQKFSGRFRPKEGKAFGVGLHSIISEKNTWIIGTIFFLFAIMFAIEGLRYQRVISSMQKSVSTLLKRHPAIESQYARENIAQKYQKIDKEERHKREVLKNLSRLMLPGVELEKLYLEGSHFVTIVKCPDEKTVLRVQTLAKEKEYKVSRIGSEKQVKIEGSL